MPEDLQIRWKLAEEPDPQRRLFGDLVEREVGKGEFRGLEFYHVRAKTIINEVPAASRMPFRYTINAYRGCSHACVYCASGDTPVLMAEGRLRPLADLRPGDHIYGTERRGAYRRYTITRVLDHWSTVKPAYRVTLEDGTRLVVSGDHRFLTDRGWKHVTGTQQGAERRPHLTLNNELMGTGAFATGPKEGPEYRRGYLCGLIRGDGHVGVYRYPRPSGVLNEVSRFRLALMDGEALWRGRSYLSESGIPTQEFLFQPARGSRSAIYAIRNQTRHGVSAVREMIRWPRRPSPEWDKGFLAGIFDAEGSYSRGILRIFNGDGRIIEEIVRSLRRFGFPFALEGRASGVQAVRVRGGVREHLRFFHLVDPAISRKRSIEGVALKSNAPLRVMEIEPLGFEMPMYDVTTGTGDFITDGVVSHNCFARPTHEYLGLDAGEDFERKIVVKINAVELLRAETEPARWAAEHIAMGTNTDPYQRAEGKYKLTRGVVEVLAERANPFSILTKNTLILRDLELLAEAARRTDVAVNLSIGTLDEEVWKTSEPNTPHPLRRMEAVTRLNEAGVRCGVLVAPVLPGLSDRPEQVEAVVRAALEAGAQTVYPILLHLRPGVKEQFMPWLERTYPRLVRAYRKLYPRSYAPKATQEELSGLVKALVERHGGRPARRNSRGIERPQPEGAPQPEQLSLGLG